jgi:hypothetical protein
MSFNSAFKSAKLSNISSISTGIYKCVLTNFEWIEASNSRAIAYKLEYTLPNKFRVNEVFWLKGRSGEFNQISLAVLKRRLQDFGADLEEFKLPEQTGKLGSFKDFIAQGPSCDLQIKVEIGENGYPVYTYKKAKSMASSAEAAADSDREEEEAPKKEKKKRAPKKATSAQSKMEDDE